MIRTVEEGLANYRAELQKYSEELRKLWRQNEDYCRKKNIGLIEALMGWDDGDFEKLVKWGGKIEGMAQALGLSEEEIGKIDKEFGLPIPGS